MSLAEIVVRFGLPALILSFIGLEVVILPLFGKKTMELRAVVAKLFIILFTLFIIMTFREVKEAPIIFEIGKVFGRGIIFKIDLLNFVFIVLAGVLWLTIGLYDFEKINYLFFNVTYIATIGTLLAGDLITFFLFFEIMTFSSYALMVYHRGEEQLEAGNVYIYMSLIGGLSILSGILMLSVYTGSFQWTNLAVEFTEMGAIKYLIAFFLIAGFGVKAGMFPFQFWVPKIYEGAPISTIALSSGMFMKIGAYGMIKVISIIFFVDVEGTRNVTSVLWKVGNNVGAILIWVGILTMVVGVFMALLQGNMKRMLAYHSVSQMGYIIMGIGVAGYLGHQGAMGYIGSVFHMINHSLFKVVLFMVAGLVYMRTKELNMYELGGLWKKMPITAILCLIAALGITGMPFFNGFASKSMLHHAIDEAFKYGHPSYRYAEMLFTLVSAGTVCSFIKFFSFIFLGEAKKKYDDTVKDHKRMNLAMGILAAFIIFIGVFPSLILENVFIPQALSFQYDPEFIGKYIEGMNFFNAHDIIGMVRVYFYGMGIFILGSKYHLFHMHLPKWASTEKYIYRPVVKFCEEFSDYCVEQYEEKIIFGDVFVYAIILTVILAGLILTGF